jgi:hypothetical protein
LPIDLLLDPFFLKDTNMNQKHLFAAIALAVIGTAASAQEATSDAWMNVASAKSFDQVRGELLQARKDGSIKATSSGYIEKAASVKSREQVRGEAIAARNSGELQALGGEAHAFTPAGASATVVAGSL